MRDSVENGVRRLRPTLVARRDPYHPQAILALGAAGLAGASLLGIDRLAGPRPWPQRRSPAASSAHRRAIGHRLRAATCRPRRDSRTEVVIVGGGIAGLGAGCRLARAGFDDIMLLDLEAAPGGNAASGRNAVSAYPWGAHYVPLLTQEAGHVRALFEDFGIITGYGANGAPLYDEYALCADPQERLYRFGRWQEGLVPAIGVGSDEQAEYKRFFARHGRLPPAHRQRRQARLRHSRSISPRRTPIFSRSTPSP